MRYVALFGEERTQNRQATELKGIKFARTMLDVQPCPVSPGLFEDRNGSHRVGWGHRDSRNFHIEKRGGTELSQTKYNGKFL